MESRLDSSIRVLMRRCAASVAIGHQNRKFRGRNLYVLIRTVRAIQIIKKDSRRISTMREM